MSSLISQPNIGKELVKKLEAVGIVSIEQLKEVGSESAVIKIGTVFSEAPCINMLFALEGAIQGIRWHHLSKERKEELKNFLRLKKI